MRICTPLAVAVIGALCAGIVQASGFESLTLTTSSPRKAFYPREPMPVTITLANKTEQALDGHSALDPAWDWLTILVAKDGEDYVPFEPPRPYERLIGAPSMTPIPPGKEFSTTATLFYSDRAVRLADTEYLFPGPGSYAIKARLYNAEQTTHIESNVLDVKAVPFPKREARAHSYLRSTCGDVYHDVFLGDYHNAVKKHECLQAFLANYPDTYHGLYVANALGNLHYWQLLDDDEDVAHEKAFELLSKAARHKDFVFAEDAMRKIVAIFLETGQLKHARQVVARMEQRFPESDRTRSARIAYEEAVK